MTDLLLIFAIRLAIVRLGMYFIWSQNFPHGGLLPLLPDKIYFLWIVRRKND